MDSLKPNFRYGLKARIINKGYRNLTEFSMKADVNLSTVSRVVSGLEFPGAKHQKRIAETLGITLHELGELLDPDRKAA